MKKDDVVRALQRCFDSKSDCQGCPVKEECDRNPSEVTTKLEKTALSIIRKQEKQIEELRLKIQLTNKAYENLIAGYRDDYDKAFTRLKAQEQEIERLNTNAEILAEGVRDLNHENYRLTKKLAKQTRIARDANAKCTGTERYLRPFQYKADRLETKCNDLKKLSDWQREEIKRLKAEVNKGCDNCETVKQAKIDVLNELREKCKFDGHTVAVYKNDIDEMIEELKK